MIPHGAKISDVLKLAGTIDPDAYTAATYVSDYVDMRQAAKLAAFLSVGTMGTNATVDAKLVQATDASGTGAKDITGKAIAQMTQAGTDMSDRQKVIEVRSDELDVVNDFTHVALSVTVATAAVDLGANLFTANQRYGGDDYTDLASLTEIVD